MIQQSQKQKTEKTKNRKLPRSITEEVKKLLNATRKETTWPRNSAYAFRSNLSFLIHRSTNSLLFHRSKTSLPLHQQLMAYIAVLQCVVARKTHIKVSVSATQAILFIWLCHMRGCHFFFVLVQSLSGHDSAGTLHFPDGQPATFPLLKLLFIYLFIFDASKYSLVLLALLWFETEF